MIVNPSHSITIGTFFYLKVYFCNLKIFSRLRNIHVFFGWYDTAYRLSRETRSESCSPSCQLPGSLSKWETFRDREPDC